MNGIEMCVAQMKYGEEEQVLWKNALFPEAPRSG
jgi:hypothetical protein